jgi:hypothetical protein
MLEIGPDGYLSTSKASNVYQQFLYVAATQQYTNPELVSGMIDASVSSSSHLHVSLPYRSRIDPIKITSNYMVTTPVTCNISTATTTTPSTFNGNSGIVMML